MITGDGRGATGTVRVGIPIPRAKSLRLIFAAGGIFAAARVPRNAVIALHEVNDTWAIVRGSKGRSMPRKPFESID